MDSSDSRKRPLDVESEAGVTKRSNQGGADSMHFKVLVPSIAAGAIIGKGGETITQIQKDTGAVIKMSKANDFYPGTSERVCLITGTLESVKKVHQFIMETIRDKPDPNPRQGDGDKVGNEDHVKILVPNSTAGMIIGKGGIFIRQIKEESGAYVQISQKSKDMNLPERCVTVAGDCDQNKKAVEMILQKILEDPQSSSCPNISYADFKGPVASSNPTGSPFANAPMGFNGNFNGQPPQQPGPQGPMGMNNLGTGMNNLNIGGNVNPAMEQVRATLRGSGFTEQAVEDISSAIYTLASYGLFGVGLGLGLGGLANLGGPQQQQQQQHHPPQQHHPQQHPQQGPGHNLSLASLAGILQGGMNAPNGAGLLGGGGNNPQDNNPSVFGPVGSTTTTMAGGDTGEGSGTYFSTAGGGLGGDYNQGNSMFGGSYDNNGSFNSSTGSYQGTNQNSFGLGTNMGSLKVDEDGDSTKKDLEVGEHIVGAILGPGGKGIVELQKFSGANIQISKKGVYAQGTRNRIVSVTGNPSAVQRGSYLIQQRISQEEAKRARQSQGQPMQQR